MQVAKEDLAEFSSRMNTFTEHKFLFALSLLIFLALAWSGEETDIVSSSYPPPPLFRGVFSIHFPLAALPADSVGGSYIWIPIPEMGFLFCPTVPFPKNNGWWEFPIHIMTLFPFLEKYAAVSDISFGAGFQVPPMYRMGISYRFIEGRFYPVSGKFYAHIAEANIAIPVKGFSGAGAIFDWIIASNLDLGSPYVSQDKQYDRYTGSAFAIAPYWNFKMRYGRLRLSYRIVLASSIVGTESQKQTTYKVKTRSVSAIEVNYTYP